MSGVGNEDFAPLQVATAAVVGPDHQNAGQFALGAGRGLESHGAHAADLGQGLLQLPQQLQRPLGQLVRGEGMQRDEAGQSGGPLVDLRVPLHGARAERIEARVDGVVELAQVDVMARQLRLRDFRQIRTLGAELICRDARQRVLGRMRDLAPAAAGMGALEERGPESISGGRHCASSVRPGRLSWR